MVHLPPPPPEVPERPPVARLEGERDVSLQVPAGGPTLAGRIRTQPGDRALLLLHPHPLYGGTMDNAVIVAIARAAARRGYSTLRFNFRGVPPSTGRYDAGTGEIDDAIAALSALRSAARCDAIDVVGYSFGSFVAAALVGRVPAGRVALLSPVPTIFTYPRPVTGARCCVLIGTRDDYTTIDQARFLAGELGARFVEIENADHFFTRGRADLAARVLDTLEATP